MPEINVTKEGKSEAFFCKTLKSDATITFTREHINGQFRGDFFHQCLNIDQCGIKKSLNNALHYDWEKCPKKHLLNP